MIKELIEIALKKKMSFEELVQENRQQILENRLLMEKIEEKMEKKQSRLRDIS